MSEEAPRYLKTLPEVGKLTNISRNGNLSEKQVENIDENHEEKERENPILLVEPIPNGDCKVNSGVELGTLEVEYIESENLKDVEDVDMCLKTLLGGLESKDWVLVCEALNDVQRLSKFHREAMLDILGNVISLVVKSLKNPRSAVCKTALMTSADIFKAYCDSVVDSIDPLLIQLDASQLSDKLPESKEAARALLLDLQNVYEETLDMTPTDVSEKPQTNSWEHFCQSKLSPLSAQAVLRVTNVAR
ncbi:hypothetical protein KY290_014121 [Solanum tuberosum]|uniref:Uncharacterized protein n=1 Tax=Solanum tuberosum TaxID=4113 RepID=A0ABQ7VNR5_SOLTU|nr:hypothetical protein KY289_014204 [Solanum tuberosum]KAH0717506.1 hypothetical protein KY285_013537 [Solanum tuberosum]KAH0770140.1 hypothetical protein KY290_014121 [Solanum tuberosum]